MKYLIHLLCPFTNRYRRSRRFPAFRCINMSLAKPYPGPSTRREKMHICQSTAQSSEEGLDLAGVCVNKIGPRSPRSHKCAHGMGASKTSKMRFSILAAAAAFADTFCCWCLFFYMPELPKNVTQGWLRCGECLTHLPCPARLLIAAHPNSGWDMTGSPATRERPEQPRAINASSSGIYISGYRT